MAVACTGCRASIDGSDVYFRPGDGASVCGRCFLGADRRSLNPGPDPRGPLGKRGSGAEVVAAVGVDLLLGLLTD